MPLKYEVESVESLPEEVKGLYVQDGEKFVLDVEGVVPKQKLDEFRNNNVELMKKLEDFKGIDPKEYTSLKELKQKVDESKLVEAGKVDEAVQARVSTLKEEYETKLQERESRLTQAERQLESTLLSSQIQRLAVKHGAEEGAMDDVMLRAQTVFRLIDGELTPLDSKGQVIYGRNGTDPMSGEEWMKGLIKTAPHLFKASVGGGAKNNGGNGQNRAKMTSTQKIQSGLS